MAGASKPHHPSWRFLSFLSSHASFIRPPALLLPVRSVDFPLLAAGCTGVVAAQQIPELHWDDLETRLLLWGYLLWEIELSVQSSTTKNFTLRLLWVVILLICYLPSIVYLPFYISDHRIMPKFPWPLWNGLPKCLQYVSNWLLFFPLLLVWIKHLSEIILITFFLHCNCQHGKEIIFVSLSTFITVRFLVGIIKN